MPASLRDGTNSHMFLSRVFFPSVEYRAEFVEEIIPRAVG